MAAKKQLYALQSVRSLYVKAKNRLLNDTNSQVVEDFDPEKNGIKANLVSFEMYWFVVQHIQNPKKSLSGKHFYDELTFGMLS